MMRMRRWRKSGKRRKMSATRLVQLAQMVSKLFHMQLHPNTLRPYHIIENFPSEAKGAKVLKKAVGKRLQHLPKSPAGSDEEGEGEAEDAVGPQQD